MSFKFNIYKLHYIVNKIKPNGAYLEEEDDCCTVHADNGNVYCSSITTATVEATDDNIEHGHGIMAACILSFSNILFYGS